MALGDLAVSNTTYFQSELINPAGDFDGLTPLTGLIDLTDAAFAPFTIDPLNSTGLLVRVEQLWISSQAAAATFSGQVWISDINTGTPPGNNFAQVYDWVNQVSAAPFSIPGTNGEVMTPVYLGDGTGSTLRVITQNAGVEGVRAIVTWSVTRTGPL